MKYGITIQRVISLVDGSNRERPIQPLRSEPGLVQIGSIRVKATFIPQTHFDVVDAMSREDWNAMKQAQRAHDCAATEMGMMCGHAS